MAGATSSEDQDRLERPARRLTGVARVLRSPKRIAFALAAVIGIAALAFFFLRPDGGPDGPTAAIVDQLSDTAPGPGFVAQATQVLEGAGYEVDYFPGEEVTVKLYRDLPTMGYDLVLVRAHAGRYYYTGAEGRVFESTLFTGEAYSEGAHVDEQIDGQLKRSFYDWTDANEQGLFGIMPDFVRSSMRGDFDGANVILMGCDILNGHGMAKAFVERGAELVVGWDAPVTAGHTDTATLAVLRRHLVDGLAVDRAVSVVQSEVGPDQYFGAVLRSYPLQDEASSSAE